MEETTTNNALLEKSYAFSIRIVKLYKYLNEKHGRTALFAQMLRAGTSIGANSEEANGSQSPRDFLSKCSIAYKETRETNYWLRLLRDTDFVETKLAESILKDNEELLKIIGTIVKTTKSRYKKL
jgi:four helix bundle protein